MSNLTLIVLMRAIHVLSAVAWSGAVFTMSGVLIPLARGGGEIGRPFGAVFQRLGVMIGGAATFAVLSGLYLFAALHRHDQSLGAVVLGAGALAAVASLAIGLLLGRPAGRALNALKVSAQSELGPPEAVRLRRRAVMSVRLMAALLGLAILAMATFRFAPALA